MAGNHTPAEIVDVNIENGVKKANLPRGKMILMGMMAGGFIALGAAAANVASHDIANVGVARILAGTVFPLGLILIVFIGGELFTGNCLMTMAVLERRATWRQMLRNLIIVFFSNLLGAAVIDLLVILSGQLDYSAGALGAYTIKIALTKTQIGFTQGIASGILCNILVCLAILMATGVRDSIGKIFAVFFPIFAFVISGYEHCVANMYYIPMGMLAAHNPDYVQKAFELYGITAAQSASLEPVNALHNFIPVTIGNVLGGALFVGFVYIYIHKKEWGEEER